LKLAIHFNEFLRKVIYVSICFANKQVILNGYLIWLFQSI